ncbi:MAG: hypothetical protein B6A08_20460 [Sorangiineae bacterium NIC37A_2]|nr:MAG: hypothetical protein B6A08_20460 [Sorangiineae bacterium NIC37A_2]
MTKTPKKKAHTPGEIAEFHAYCWSYYGGKNALYPESLPKLTNKELNEGIQEALKLSIVQGELDSVSREIVRDLLLLSRGVKKVEHEKLIERERAKQHKPMSSLSRSELRKLHRFALGLSS